MTKKPQGYWIPVLHAHLPFVKHPEHAYFLEEHWLFEAISETLIRLNLQIASSDRNAGVILANGTGGLRHSQGRRVAVAVYVQEIDADPTTQVDLVAVFPYYYVKSEQDEVRDTIMAEFQKVLLSYR